MKWQCNLLIWNLESARGAPVKKLYMPKAGPRSWKRPQLPCKAAWSAGNSLVVDDKSIGVAPLGDVVMVPPVLAVVCHHHLLAVLIIANCAQLTVLQWAGIYIKYSLTASSLPSARHKICDTLLGGEIQEVKEAP